MEQAEYGRPRQRAHISINDREARELLERLASDDQFRAELTSNPREVLFEHRIDLSAESVPEEIQLPPKEEIRSFIDSYLATKGETKNVLGFAILYWVLGAMPLVVAEADGAG